MVCWEHFLSNLHAIVQFHSNHFNVAHEEHLEIIWCKNNDSLRKGKKKDGFYESSLSAGRGPSGAGLVITLLYLL